RCHSLCVSDEWYLYSVLPDGSIGSTSSITSCQRFKRWRIKSGFFPGRRSSQGGGRRCDHLAAPKTPRSCRGFGGSALQRARRFSNRGLRKCSPSLCADPDTNYL